jgi:hypothetical protein
MPDLHQLLAERKKASEIKKDRRGKYHSESEGEDEDNVPSRKERDPALNDVRYLPCTTRLLLTFANLAGRRYRPHSQ